MFNGAYAFNQDIGGWNVSSTMSFVSNKYSLQNMKSRNVCQSNFYCLLYSYKSISFLLHIVYDVCCITLIMSDRMSTKYTITCKLEYMY